MRTFISSVSLLTVLSTLAVGCAQGDSSNDDLAGEADVSEDSTDSAKADAAGNAGYFTLEAKRVRGPADGFVVVYDIRRANSARTKCADGVKREACTVSTLDTKAITFTFGFEEQSLKLFLLNQIDNGSVALMVRGQMTQSAFVATEVWRQEADLTGAPNHGLDGVAVKIKDSGIRCITAPCPTIVENKLNSVKSQNIENYSAQTDALTSQIGDSIFSGKPVIVIGDLIQVTTQTTTPERFTTTRTRQAGAVFTRIGK
jgi:hypothetical protein